MERYKRVEEWKKATQDAWDEQQGRRKINGFAVVQIEIPFTQRRRRDPHNYCGTILKSIIDGIVKAGAIEDDNEELLGHREPILKVGGEVVVRIEELEERWA